MRKILILLTMGGWLIACGNELSQDTDTDVQTDADADSDSDSDSDTDTDADTDADTDSDTDSDSDAETDSYTTADSDTGDDSESAGGVCEYECSEHCISIGGVVMEGTCSTAGYKCCLLTEPESDVDSESDALPDSEIPLDTESETDSVMDTDSGDGCIAEGSVTYTLNRVPNPNADQQAAYDLITDAMDLAVYHYNCYTDLTKTITANYEPSVATADGNINGNIRFGQPAYMQVATAMHEIAHTLGIGTSSDYTAMFNGGVFTGASATALLRELDNDSQAEIHGDSQHFWPYGLNYESEYKTESDLVNHCKLVRAILFDMGWL